MVLGVGAAVIAYLLVGNDGSSSSAPAAPSPPPAVVQPTVPAIPARVVTQLELKAEASTSDHPIYWAGPRPGVRYELTRSTDGRTYVRYLTGNAEVGDPNASYLAVATYPQTGGFDAILGEAAKPANTRIDLPADYQVEVFAPSPGKAERLVRQGQVRPLGGGTPVATGEALALKLLALRAIARRTPFYWAGARQSTTYELTPGGRIFVRYLSGGAKVGDRRAKFLTIATYPAANAFAQIKSVANKKGIVTLELPHGGLAVLNPKRPTSVYLGYPGVAYQVEVFSPKLGEARSLVEHGEITRAG